MAGESSFSLGFPVNCSEIWWRVEEMEMKLADLLLIDLAHCGRNFHIGNVMQSEPRNRLESIQNGAPKSVSANCHLGAIVGRHWLNQWMNCIKTDCIYSIRVELILANHRGWGGEERRGWVTLSFLLLQPAAIRPAFVINLFSIVTCSKTDRLTHAHDQYLCQWHALVFLPGPRPPHPLRLPSTLFHLYILHLFKWEA